MSLLPASLQAADVFIRLRVNEPSSGRLQVSLYGHRHEGPNWHLPEKKIDVDAGQWSDWLDLSQWPLHPRLKRAGGLAEWPSPKVKLSGAGRKQPIHGCKLDVQLADKPADEAVVISFSESSESDTIGFLLPNPLREHASEFETGSQMTARQRAWAMDIAGGETVTLDHFDICTTLWGHYDPGLARQSLETLRLLGFNVVNGAPTSVLREAGVRVLGKTWDYLVDPEESSRKWKLFREEKLPARLATEDGRWEYANMRHLVISDEVKAFSFKKVDKLKRDQWFREYLRQRVPGDAGIGTALDRIEFPLEMMEARTLPRDADARTRRIAYHAAKFGQWWSARQLRQTTDEIQRAIPGMKSETLPAGHGFFNAWGPPHIGMSYPLLDLFEVAAQQAVDVLSAEDWLGLNHMYGPAYTWTGAQSFEYLNAIMRSAIGDHPMKLLSLITPSDDHYLRLKAFSSLAQGAKAFYFWTFGPTYIGSENYWSDLRSEYEGIARFTRMLDQAEDVLGPARPVSDRVAILYSVSHDLWYADQPAAFVEKRLLWHALRHLGVQPDFVREEDVEGGRLEKYQALFVVDWCISRGASAAIDKWTRQGGILYLSANAATRDEFHEAYLPAFADAVWDNAARPTIQVGHSFNERTDLPSLEPIASVSVHFDDADFRLPVLGCRLNVRRDAGSPCAAFDDGARAGTIVALGQGQVMGLGFMPMLAYGHLAGFQPQTLAEKWPPEPRRLIREVLDRADVTPVAKPEVAVVEASLLAGPQASAVVLANYTYQPLPSLSVIVKSVAPIKSATSVEHGTVRLSNTDKGVRITLPLEWTDIVLLQHE